MRLTTRLAKPGAYMIRRALQGEVVYWLSAGQPPG